MTTATRTPEGRDAGPRRVEMSRPVVGLTCYLERARWNSWDEPAALIGEHYLRSLTQAGARTVIVPQDVVDNSVLDRLDGLVLAGGADVDPATYAADPHSATGPTRPERDQAEIMLYTGARERGMPVLGICRGLQIMSIATGGSLHQHLPDLVGDTSHRSAPGTFNDHGATFAPGSLIARIVGAEHTVVNSSHHQAVADPGLLTVTGWAQDATIEVAEDPAAHFGLGVQWHPEVVQTEVSARIFAAFATAAGRWAADGRRRASSES